MSEVRFQKTEWNEPLSVTLPSSKSLTHRALIAASLAEGVSHVKGVAMSKDIEATMRALSCFGIQFEAEGTTIHVHGCGGKLAYTKELIDCGESGSTLRFLIPLAALLDEEVTFTGHGRLLERPQSVYEELFKEQGIKFEKKAAGLVVCGKLKSGDITLRGDVSSQFITGLMFALPLCKGDSTLHILPPFESASYVGLTMDALSSAGVSVKQNGLEYAVKGEQTYRTIDAKVEGDDSQAAFFAELALIHQKEIEVKNMNHDSHQGDHVLLSYLAKMGADVKETEEGYAFTCTNLHGTEMDLQDCPDLGPALFALASQAEGESHFTHCERLRIKESDRIAAMEEELKKLGVDIFSDEGNVWIRGKKGIQTPAVLHGHNDHRIVMALACLGSLDEDITIQDAQAITKSYPAFFEDLKKIGVYYD